MKIFANSSSWNLFPITCFFCVFGGGGVETFLISYLGVLWSRELCIFVQWTGFLQGKGFPPNIDSYGTIGLDILKEKWSPDLSISRVMCFFV